MKSTYKMQRLSPASPLYKSQEYLTQAEIQCYTKYLQDLQRECEEVDASLDYFTMKTPRAKELFIEFCDINKVEYKEVTESREVEKDDSVYGRL